MTTSAEALTLATSDLRAATTSVLGVLSEMRSLKEGTVSDTKTIIKDFETRPYRRTIYLDAVNGSESNTGASVDKPRKDIDAVIGEMSGRPLDILLLSDVTLKYRTGVDALLRISGAQKSNNGLGYAYTRRQVGFLGTALNSPHPMGWTQSAGLFLEADLYTQSIDFLLPDVPALDLRAHLLPNVDVSISSLGMGLLVQSSSAGCLIGGLKARTTLTSPVSFGTNAAGHLFENVAAGENPNSNYYYTSNIKSA